MEGVKVVRISKRFGSVIAVNNVTFAVQKGEFFTLLGPSGCGKTTTLRIIAGFEKPDSGQVYIGGKMVNEYPPEKRNIGYVFQNYALFPHMTVFENIAFPMRIKKLNEEEIKKRVKYLLEFLKLEGLENRYPKQLSGGQQQRVALARALARDPEVLLLDEPLSNLDALLRIEIRRELKNIQRKTRITTIYVTHDQDEAFSLSDRIAVMNRGVILAIDTPTDLFENPKTSFIAKFLRYKNVIEVRTIDQEIEILKKRFKINEFSNLEKEPKYVAIRPDVIHVKKELDENVIQRDEYIIFKAKLRDKLFYGSSVEVYLGVDAHELITVMPIKDANHLNIGDDVYVYIKKADIKFLIE